MALYNSVLSPADIARHYHAGGSVLANDSDPEDDALTVVAFSQGANGGVSGNDNSVTYIPAAGFTGVDNFSYTINDSLGAAATANVSVTVTAVNQPPSAMADSIANPAALRETAAPPSRARRTLARRAES